MDGSGISPNRTQQMPADRFATVRQILVAAQLEAFIQKFVDENITDDLVFDVSDNDFKVLFGSLGTFTQFKKALQAFKAQQSIEAGLGTSSRENEPVALEVQDIEMSLAVEEQATAGCSAPAPKLVKFQYINISRVRFPNAHTNGQLNDYPEVANFAVKEFLVYFGV